MKILRYFTYLIGLCLLILGSCVEPYQPPVIEQENSHLVVEGFLNTGGGPTVIRLSRTQQLDETGKPASELKARVTIEGERGSQFALTERGNGEYVLPGFRAVSGEKYRLRIKTTGGKEYPSELVPVKPTPAIDAISWEALNDGVHVYVNTHDPGNNTLYYRWDFEETWEYTVPYPATIEYKNGTSNQITDNLYRCWTTTASKNIYIGSSVRLSEDIIYKYPIEFIPIESVKHSIKYSILVRQYALTKEAYQYWENLRKNTENIGTLFDPLPSQLSSNITCVNAPEEKVFGFFSAHSVTEQRIFISRNELPKWRRFTGYESCAIDTVLKGDLPKSGNYSYFFVGEVMSTNGPMMPIGYTKSSAACMDCRTAGTNIRPTFWK